MNSFRKRGRIAEKAEQKLYQWMEQARLSLTITKDLNKKLS